MAASIENLIKNLPMDAQTAQANLTKEEDVRQLLYNAEQFEMGLAGTSGKIEPRIISIALLEQLLLNLILNQLPYAKYLWRRLPKELKADPDAATLWKIGQSMWKSEYETVYGLIDATMSSNINEVFKPFLEKLRVEYRRRCINLVGLSYSNITVKELLGYVANSKDKNVCGKDGGIEFIKKSIINDFGLERAWILDEKSGIIEIKTNRETYELDPKLLQEFTKYVCFMEAQQTV